MSNPPPTLPPTPTTIANLPTANAVTGSEFVAISQNGVTVKTTLGAVTLNPSSNNIFTGGNTFNGSTTLNGSAVLNGTTTLNGAVNIDGALNIAPFYPVVHPSSGNLQGSGLPVGHQLVWSDANPIFYADTITLQCTDPSALVTINLTGSVTVGDTITLHFLFNSHNYTASYTAVSGDTLTKMAAGLVAAIQANPNLFIPISATNISGGGLPGQILYVTNAASANIYFDYDVRTLMTMTASVSGSATEIVTLPSGGNPLPTALDSNPLLALQRFTIGYPPSAGSNCGQIGFYGTTSGGGAVAYALLTTTINNSTAGSLSASLLINPAREAGGCGLYIDTNGIYTVGATGGATGTDTFNSKGYFINGVNLAGNLPATATNNNATAGHVGEYISSTVLSGSAISLTNATAADITSISLTAGDWDVSGSVALTLGGSTVLTQFLGWTNTVSATQPTVPGNGAYFLLALPFATGGAQCCPTGTQRLSLSTTTTVYLSALAVFSVSTAAAYGIIRARRVR